MRFNLIKSILTIALLCGSVFAKDITPNEVYAQVRLIQEKIHILHKHIGVEHDHEDEGGVDYQINTKLKPRNTWQKTYEIMLKINILRVNNNLPVIEPVNMAPVLNLNPILVYEQTQRILTELDIFILRVGIKNKTVKLETFKNKTPLDVFNALNSISHSLDELNGTGFTPSYVFGEMMRVYGDIVTVLQHLKIEDNTIPTKRDNGARPSDTFDKSMKILGKIKQIQAGSGIEGVDFYSFKKDEITPSDVFGMTQMILSELQPIKAYIGLNNYITPAATQYNDKTPADVDQMMGWVLRKISLLDNHTLTRGVSK